MMNDLLTQQIMKSVASRERYRLLRVARISLPILLLFSISLALMTHKTILRLIERQVFTIAVDLEYDTTKIDSIITRVGNFTGEEVINGDLVLVLLSGAGVFLVVKRSKLNTFPKRLLEIRKYLV